MNIFIKILPLILCLCFLAGCSTCNCDDTQQNKTPQNTCSLSGTTPVSQDDITYKFAGTDIYYAVLSSSSTECKINITTTSCAEMTFGEMYHLEKLVDGNFEKVEWKNEAYFTAIGYLIRTDEPVEKTYKWEPFLGELESGTYHIVTDFYRDGEKINARFEFFVDSIPDKAPNHMTPSPMTTPTDVPKVNDTSMPAVFNTSNIKEISFYTENGLSKEYKVPEKYLAGTIAWIDSITVEKEIGDELPPPGTGFYHIKITYFDGSVCEGNLDTAEINGISYYLKSNGKPDFFYEILSD